MAERIASIAGEAGSRALVLIGDAVGIAQWKGSADPKYADLAARVAGDAGVFSEREPALVVDGGAPCVDVIRVDATTWILAGRTADVDPTSVLVAAIAPLSDEAAEPFELAIESSLLALHHAPAAAVAVGMQAILKLKKDPVLTVANGVVLNLAGAHRLEVVADPKEIRAPWGSIARRYFVRAIG